MNDSTQTPNRTPLFATMAALALLGAGGGYLYTQQGKSNAGAVDSARSEADRASAAAGMSSEDRKATEAVVRAYILEHPEILTEAAQILEQRALAKRLDAAGGELTTAFAGAVDGNPKGDVTLVEFTDYNCGFCRSSLPDARRFGRFPVPVDSTVCDWLTLNGRPVRARKIPLNCQPPNSLSTKTLSPVFSILPLPIGKSYVQLELKVCLMSKSETARSRLKS